MKPGVRIVNCARGEIIDENDLIAALESKQGRAARRWTCSREEPLPADHPFRKLPNVLLTPHLGASTEEAQEKCGIEVAEVIAAYLLTGEVRNAVNLPFLDAKTYEQVQAVSRARREARQTAQPTRAGAMSTACTSLMAARRRNLPNIDPITRAILHGLLAAPARQGCEQCQCARRRRRRWHDGRGKANRTSR